MPGGSCDCSLVTWTLHSQGEYGETWHSFFLLTHPWTLSRAQGTGLHPLWHKRAKGRPGPCLALDRSETSGDSIGLFVAKLSAWLLISGRSRKQKRDFDLKAHLSCCGHTLPPRAAQGNSSLHPIQHHSLRHAWSFHRTISRANIEDN